MSLSPQAQAQAALIKKTILTPQQLILFAKQHSTLLFTTAIAAATSSFLYFYTQRQHRNAAHSLESKRKRGISKRKLLTRPDEKYASLKVLLIIMRSSRNNLLNFNTT